MRAANMMKENKESNHKERPILFSGDMVRAILHGRKTQTRRLIKESDIISIKYDSDGEGGLVAHETRRCFYGLPGDRLWVRETWQHSNHPYGPYEPGCETFYRADYLDDPLGPNLERSPDGIRRQWRPSIHMPRAASRITLEIASLHEERLQDISELDCLAEGCAGGHGSIPGYPYHATPREHYRWLWNSLNGAGAWEDNPYVWVLQFRPVTA